MADRLRDRIRYACICYALDGAPTALKAFSADRDTWPVAATCTHHQATLYAGEYAHGTCGANSSAYPSTFVGTPKPVLEGQFIISTARLDIYRIEGGLTTTTRSQSIPAGPRSWRF